MITPTEEPKFEDMTLEPKEKDTPQPDTRTIPTLADYNNLQELKIEGFLERQSVIILIDARSTHNIMSSKVAAHLMLQKEDYNRFKVKVANGQILKYNQKCPRKRKAGDSTREPSYYNHNTTLGGVPKEKSNGFPIQIQAFHEIEDKNPLPQFAEILGISTKPSRLPPLKLSDHPLLNRLKLLLVVARPYCFLQPQKDEEKRVVQEMIETRIVRPCLFPAMTYPYIVFSRDKLLLKCYIPSNSPWLLISCDFHDFPQDRTMMLKDFLDDDLRSMAQDCEKIEPL
ncbi:hypothetical protein B296_00020025 [Ensete ventricosum]|uniref:Uncharacterized protein n=1 Tax=Ensete ventricosum TaxID=4639 RepID=A0A426X161_ENSVE|nr:hypothetical protein B296_00020025 [Ensete ventricosum]